jgi:hypothetical protein
MFQAFAPQDSSQNVILFLLPVGRNQSKDGTSHHFTGRIAKNLLRASVPTGDGAVQVFADDGIV